jgi:hypothetical protein
MGMVNFWSRRKIFTVIFLVIFPPIGIYLVVRSKTTAKKKWIFSLLGATWLAFVIWTIVFAPPSITVASSTKPVDDASYLLNGNTYPENAYVTINGKAIDTTNGEFKATLPLTEGDNKIAIVSTDGDKKNTEVVTVHRNTKAEIAQRKAEEKKKQTEAEAKKQAEDAKKQAAENKKKASAESKKKAEEAKKTAEDAKKQAAAAKKKADEAKKKADAVRKQEAKKKKAAPKPKATYSAVVSTAIPVDPATLHVTVTVKNTSQVAGKPSCTVNVSSVNGTYHGFDIFDVTQTIAPGQEYTFTGNLTITKEGANYVTAGHADCT